jgi:hypothetical protein
MSNEWFSIPNEPMHHKLSSSTSNQSLEHLGPLIGIPLTTAALVQVPKFGFTTLVPIQQYPHAMNKSFPVILLIKCRYGGDGRDINIQRRWSAGLSVYADTGVSKRPSRKTTMARIEWSDPRLALLAPSIPPSRVALPKMRCGPDNERRQNFKDTSSYVSCTNQTRKPRTWCALLAFTCISLWQHFGMATWFCHINQYHSCRLQVERYVIRTPQGDCCLRLHLQRAGQEGLGSLAGAHLHLPNLHTSSLSRHWPQVPLVVFTNCSLILDVPLGSLPHSETGAIIPSHKWEWLRLCPCSLSLHPGSVKHANLVLRIPFRFFVHGFGRISLSISFT